MNQNAYRNANPRRDPLHPPLFEKTVLIVGLGGAADIALDLFKCGVDRFFLFDHDVLEPGNLIRHACGSRHVGKNKAEATKALLEEYSGTALVRVFPSSKNIFDVESGFEDAMGKADVAVIATDTDASRAYANDVSVEKGVPAVFVSMFENGCGGEIFVHRPGGCCYGCLMLHQERHEFFERYQNTERKADCSSARDVRSMPGIGIDQRFLSAIASRTALDLLLEGSAHALPPISAPIASNWTVFSVSGIEGILENPLSSLRYRMERHPDCRCGNHSVR